MLQGVELRGERLKAPFRGWCRTGPSPRRWSGLGGLATTHHSFLSSFSAVSTATIATKYSFFQDFRDLQDFHILHRSDLKISAKKSSQFCHFWIIWIRYLPKEYIFSDQQRSSWLTMLEAWCFLVFCQIISSSCLIGHCSACERFSCVESQDGLVSRTEL